MYLSGQFPSQEHCLEQNLVTVTYGLHLLLVRLCVFIHRIDSVGEDGTIMLDCDTEVEFIERLSQHLPQLPEMLQMNVITVFVCMIEARVPQSKLQSIVPAVNELVTENWPRILHN